MWSLRDHSKPQLCLDHRQRNPTKGQSFTYKIEGTETKHPPPDRDLRNCRANGAALQCIMPSLHLDFRKTDLGCKLSIQKRTLAFTAVQWQVRQQVVEVWFGTLGQWIVEQQWWLISDRFKNDFGYTSKHLSRPSLAEKERCFQRKMKMWWGRGCHVLCHKL